MFEQTFVEGTGKTRKGLSVFFTFVGELVLLGIAILIPLIYTDTLPRAQLMSFLTAPPPPPPPPPPAPVVQKIVKVAPRQFDAGRLMAPKEIPKNVAIIQEDQPPPSMASGVVGGVPGGIPGVGGSGLGSLLNAPPPPPPPPPPPKVEAPKPTAPSRIKVGGNVQAANLVKQVKPPYPPLARQARIQGVVHFTAVIGKDGTIQNLTLVSGHPLLVAAAQEAVKQWIYRPTLLNGEPVEVITQIDVNFTLSQ